MKEFIRDNGKVRECTSNIAKMNILEWIYYRRGMIYRNTVESISTGIEGIVMFLSMLLNIMIIILSPITLPIAAWLQIRVAKKEMELLGN